jgi:hypothetical protein
MTQLRQVPHWHPDKRSQFFLESGLPRIEAGVVTFQFLMQLVRNFHFGSRFHRFIVQEGDRDLSPIDLGDEGPVLRLCRKRLKDSAEPKRCIHEKPHQDHVSAGEQNTIAAY